MRQHRDRFRPGGAGLVVLLVGLVAPLLLGGPLSFAAAGALPRTPDRPRLLNDLDPGAARPRVRDLPAGLSARDRTDPASALRRDAADALGAAGAEALLARLDDEPTVDYGSWEPGPDFSGGYPGRYGWMERLLDEAPEGGSTPAASRLAAVLIAAHATGLTNPHPALSGPHPDLAPFAQALLARAELKDCDAQLNRLLLMTADDKPHDNLVAVQALAAAAACPGDPTASWLLTQFQAQRALVATVGDLLEMELPVPGDRVARAERSGDQLVTRFPGSPDAWLGFGDVHLRLGQELVETQPFTSRRHLKIALAAYERAAELGDAQWAPLGRARALVRLQEAPAAIKLLATSENESVSRGPALDVLLEAEEQAHDYEAAVSTAHQIVQLGALAYPRTGPLYPRQDPLTTGAGRLVSLDVRLVPGDNAAGGGASVADISYIPTYRPAEGVTGSVHRCAQWSWVRDAFLSGHAQDAVDPPADVEAASFGDCSSESIQAIARAELREAGSPWPDDEDLPRGELTTVEDGRQNAWRWAGDFDRAAAAVADWDDETGGSQALPALRLGEIRFLQRRYEEAATAFGAADRRSARGYRIEPLSGRARLAQATALLSAGRRAEGRAVLLELERDAGNAEAQYRVGEMDHVDESAAQAYRVLTYYARLALADDERVHDELGPALDHYGAATELLPRLLERQAEASYADEDPVRVVPGVLDNNRAIAELAAHLTAEARQHAQAALGADPGSQAFALTAAAAAQQEGDPEAAIRADEATLDLDPDAFPAANNLALLMVSAGRPSEAVALLRRAVAIRPDYAVAWHNLGVLYGARPWTLLASQGAYAKARTIDPSMAEQPRSLKVDETVYETHLDLSKPVPTFWSLASVERRQPLAALSLLGVLVATVGLTRVVTGTAASGVEKFIASATAPLRSSTWLGRRRHLLWGLAGVLSTFGLALLWSGGYGTSATIAYLAGLGCLVAAVVTAREVVAQRSGVRLVQRSWPPGLLVGLASGALGTPWAPLPYVRGSARAAGVHLVGPALLVGAAGALLLEWVLWPAPLTRAIAVAAVTMAVSLLVPVRPMDGSHVGRPGAVVGAGAVAIAGLLAFGLL